MIILNIVIFDAIQLEVLFVWTLVDWHGAAPLSQ